MPNRIIKVIHIESFETLYHESKKERDLSFEFALTDPAKNKVGAICAVLAVENSHISSLCLDFTEHPLSDQDISDLVAFLRSDNCPASVNLILAKTSLNITSLTILATSIAEGCKASEVKLGLGGNRLGNEGVRILANALHSPHSPLKVSLNLANNDISDIGLIALAEMLNLPSNTQKLSLNLLFNPTTVVGSTALIEGMKCGTQKNSLSIMYEFSKHGVGMICGLASALKSNRCPQELSLQFGVKHLTNTEIGILFEALQTTNCPNQVELDLSEQGLKDECFATILDALEEMPENLKIKIHLVYNAIKQEGAKKLSEFIVANKIQSKIYLDLSENSFGGLAGTSKIHQAIVETPQILNYLSIEGPTQDITELCKSIQGSALELPVSSELLTPKY